MDLIIKNKFTVVNVLKKTKAKMFESLQGGDQIEIRSTVCSLGSSRGRSYSASLRVENCSTGEAVYKTYNELGNTLMAFDLEPAEGSGNVSGYNDDPETFSEAVYQRNTILDVVRKILIQSGKVNSDKKMTGAEVLFEANEYLGKLKG